MKNDASQQQSSQPSKDHEHSSTITRSFSLIREDVRLIESVRSEEDLLSDSAALRRLIRDGMKYRNLRKEAELEIAKQIHSDYRSQSQAPSYPSS